MIHKNFFGEKEMIILKIILILSHHMFEVKKRKSLEDILTIYNIHLEKNTMTIFGGHLFIFEKNKIK